jgi:hypothetical protein
MIIKTKSMKKITFIGLSTILLVACSSPKLSAYAVKTDLSGKAKYDFNKSKIRDNGRGFAINMKALGKMPKRVALVSFYVSDPGITKVSGTNQTGKSYNTTNTGSENAKSFANSFYNISIEPLKATFKNYGIDLLMPSEFLTDNDKRESYNNFIVKHTTLNKIGEKINKFFKRADNLGTTLEVEAAATNFEVFKIQKTETSNAKKKSVPSANLSGSADGQMIESLGYDLAAKLGVDAVLIIYNTQLADNNFFGKTRFFLSAVNMQLFGPNPTTLKEGKKDNNLYSKGLFYCGTRMAFKKGLIINPKIKDEVKKAENERNNDLAYKNMMISSANKIGAYLQTELSK